MNQDKNNQVGTRQTLTSQHQQNQSTKLPSSGSAAKSNTKRKSLSSWIRIPLRILRIFLVPFLCVAALVTGLVIGYVYMGGRDSEDVWNLGTWKHLFELVFAS